jgi:cytochrome c556
MKKLGGLAASLALGIALWVVTGPGRAGSNNKPFVPSDIYKELVGREAKILKDSLKGSPSEEQLVRARLAAVMLARLALDADNVGGEAAGLQRTALQIAKLLGNKDIAEARKLAAAKVVVGGKVEVFDARPLIADAMDAMNHLRQKKNGGDGIHPDLQTSGPLKNLNGIEEKIRTLAKRKLTDTALNKSAKEMVLLGYRTAVLAEVVNDFAPGQKTKQWRDFSAQMRDASINLAQASQKKDAAAIFKAGSRLDASCNDCHKVFR